MAIGPANYNYDALDRLTQEQTATRRKTYAYDATGNRKTRYGYTTTNGVEVQSSTQLLYYAADSNRLTSDANIPVVMDATGNSLQRSPSRVHNYDEQGRLSQVLNPTALYADFAYNALGQRTIKRAYLGTVLDFTVTQLYGQDGQLLGLVRYNNLGKISWAQYWIWLDGMPLAQLELRYNTNGAVTSTNLYYLHSDHLNTPRLATNQAQTLLWKWDSDAFGLGNPIGDVDGDGVVVDIPLRFPGQIFEAYSNLNYNYFRDYEANTGRYVQSDPIGLRGGLNTYGYVGGNPLLFIDQYGLLGSTGLNTPENRELKDKARTISDCLCEIDPIYCGVGEIEVGPQPLLSYLQGVLPGGETSMSGKITINSGWYNQKRLRTAEGVSELRETVAHESLHVKQSAFDRWMTERGQFDDGMTHQYIWDKAESDSRQYKDKIDECQKKHCF